MATCVLYLENYHGQYHPGSTIRGKVICSFPKSIHIRGVRISLQGKEHTEWTRKERQHDNSSNTSKEVIVRYRGNNNFLEVVHTLTGEANYGAGRHEYPFTLNLPPNLPSTFQNNNGSILYSIKGSIGIPFGFDHKDEKELKVVAPVDLNEVPGIMMTPVSCTSEKNVRWLFRTCGLITMKVYLEKNAFVPGERVKIQLELSNMSTENVTKVEVEMRMTIDSQVTYPSAKSTFEREVLGAVSDTGVGAHGQRTYHFDLVVPNSCVVPNFSLCKLFSCSANLGVTATIKGFHSNMELCIPILLGTVSRRNPNPPQNTYVQQSAYPVLPSAPSEELLQGVSEAQFFGEPPPPYSELPSTSVAPSHTLSASAPEARSAPRDEVDEDEFVLL